MNTQSHNFIDFNEKKGFLCDMDGVIYHGNRILPGVAEFIRWLHDKNKEYLFLKHFFQLNRPLKMGMRLVMNLNFHILH